MTIVPTTVSLISGVAVVAALGTLLTLVHRGATPVSVYHADTSTSADITPTLTSLGSPQISVNGVSLPATNGTTTVPTPSGEATVTVSGDQATVSTSNGNLSRTTSTPSGNLNISIQTSSSGSNDATSTTFQEVSSNSSMNSSSSSHTSVRASGPGHADIQTH